MFLPADVDPLSPLPQNTHMDTLSQHTHIYAHIHTLSLSPSQGLEVSKGGRYHTFSDKNFLEMSDSGVEFNSAALPLDSDTDVPHTYNFHLDSDSIAATVVAEGDLSANQNNDSATSTIGSPAAQPDAAPDGDLMGTATPENTPRRGDLEAGSPKATEVVDEAPAPEAGDQAAAEST